jgi:hypothetical protein
MIPRQNIQYLISRVFAPQEEKSGSPHQVRILAQRPQRPALPPSQPQQSTAHYIIHPVIPLTIISSFQSHTTKPKWLSRHHHPN